MVTPMKRISAIPEMCSGCRICEMVCAQHHYRVNNPKKSAIRVFALYPNPVIRTPIVCRQCDDPECQKSCPTEAIEVVDGILRIDPDLCTNCLLCVEACPYESIFVHDDLEAPIKCDLCSGTPRCTDACPKDALELVDKLGEQPEIVGGSLEFSKMKSLEIDGKGSDRAIKYLQGGRRR
jgi:Fe-S-cluster-containing hydrogenase component 2